MGISSTRRTNRERRAESTAAVEQTACRLFAERGYRSTSMERIAREVGLTKGAVYFYYKDKSALLLHLLTRSKAQFFDQVFGAMEEGALSPTAQMDVFLERMIRAGAELDRYLLILPIVMSTEFKGRGDAVEGAIGDIYAGIYDRLSRVIAEGQESGEFSSRAEARALAAMIVALTDGLILEIYRQSSGVPGKDIAAAARATVMALLGAE